MMKRSQIIIICTIILAITWILINGWLHVNAYNIIKSCRTCSYAKVTVEEKTKQVNSFNKISKEENTAQLKSFKKICIDADKIKIYPKVYIMAGNKCEFSFSNSMKNAVSTRVSGDTLYLKIISKTSGMSGSVNIHLPILNSINIKTTKDSTLTFSRPGVEINISDFKCNSLYVNNYGQNDLILSGNKLKKLEIKGNFFNNTNIIFSEFAECDSLDFDIEGQNGTLKLGSGLLKMKVNPKQWIRIKMPESFRIEANAMIARKIILKK